MIATDQHRGMSSEGLVNELLAKSISNATTIVNECGLAPVLVEQKSKKIEKGYGKQTKKKDWKSQAEPRARLRRSSTIGVVCVRRQPRAKRAQNEEPQSERVRLESSSNELDSGTRSGEVGDNW